MQVVVELPDEYYEALRNSSHVYLMMGGRGNGKTLVSTILVAVANGTPLPKGHGRLIDADAMKTIKNIQSANFNAFELIRYWIDNQPTIIEADKAESEE